MSSYINVGEAGRFPAPPEATRTHTPLDWDRALHFIREQLMHKFSVVREEVGLSKNKQQIFACWRVEGEGEIENCLGFRSSYNKSLSTGICSGVSVVVCDNLCFRGSDYNSAHKNTPGGWGWLEGALKSALSTLGCVRGEWEEKIRSYRDVICSEERGAELVGLAQYSGVLPARMANTAREEWRASERNLWGVYNAMTSGLHGISPPRRIEVATGIDSWLTTSGRMDSVPF